MSEVLFHIILCPFFYWICITPSSLGTSCRGCVALSSLGSRLCIQSIFVWFWRLYLILPVDDEVIRSCIRAVERFEGSEFPVPLCFFDCSYYWCCIGCGGIVGVYVNRWIVHPRVFVDDGTVLLQGDDDGEVSIGVSFFEVVLLYSH